jgi:hypothetical protein
MLRGGLRIIRGLWLVLGGGIYGVNWLNAVFIVSGASGVVVVFVFAGLKGACDFFRREVLCCVLDFARFCSCYSFLICYSGSC